LFQCAQHFFSEPNIVPVLPLLLLPLLLLLLVLVVLAVLVLVLVVVVMVMVMVMVVVVVSLGVVVAAVVAMVVCVAGMVGVVVVVLGAAVMVIVVVQKLTILETLRSEWAGKTSNSVRREQGSSQEVGLWYFHWRVSSWYVEDDAVNNPRVSIASVQPY
jgi:hypothetical protein